MSAYEAFLADKSQLPRGEGLTPVWMPDFLFDFQRVLIERALNRGRSAIFADTGLGKSAMELSTAQNVIEQTNGRVLIVSPLAVSYQIQLEAQKWGIPCQRSQDGTAGPGITLTNYERLERFTAQDFVMVCADESGAIKHFGTVRQRRVTEFMRQMRYRLLATATAAPNDYPELGTSSEALGYLGHMDMLNQFFKNDKNNSSTGRFHGQATTWRFRGHAELPFWRWVCSWATAVRKPSDLGGDDTPYALPPLIQHETVITTDHPRAGMLFDLPAHTLPEQREERRLTLNSRCEAAAEKISQHETSIAWCHLNTEGDYLTKLIPGARQITGSDTDEYKESTLIGFMRGDFPVLVTKPSIAGWGLNFQHCAHMTMFPSHSFEQFYQAIRRCWRFGQTSPVTVDMITSEGELGVLKNLQRKSEAADVMYDQLVQQMNQFQHIDRRPYQGQDVQVPVWMTTLAQEMAS